VLVALQFALIVGLGWLDGPAFLHAEVPAVSWAALLTGAALALWALSCNRPGNFNIRPTPREGGRLIQRGPYRWVRHPMYVAVLCCGLAFVLAGHSVLGWLCEVALTVVLHVKASFEERWLLGAHADYADYRARTSRYLPGLY